MARKITLSRDEVLDLFADRIKKNKGKDADWFKLSTKYLEMTTRVRRSGKPEKEEETVDVLVRRMEKEDAESRHSQRPEETGFDESSEGN